MLLTEAGIDMRLGTQDRWEGNDALAPTRMTPRPLMYDGFSRRGLQCRVWRCVFVQELVFAPQSGRAKEWGDEMREAYQHLQAYLHASTGGLARTNDGDDDDDDDDDDDEEREDQDDGDGGDQEDDDEDDVDDTDGGDDDGC
jgi:hypothetical protein